MSNNFPYIGNGAYCYSNATSMLLAAQGEDVSPALIEPITGVGLSASVENNGFLFLNNQVLEPDLGIVSALKILGFRAEVYVSEDHNKMPFDQLKEVLGKGPVILGPLDMGYLVYNPDHSNMHGSDHFVLAYGFDGDNIYLHDPAGFPHVFLDKDNLQKSWKADKIAYCRGCYRYIANVQREASPNQKEIYQLTLKRFQNIYQKGEVNTSTKLWSIGKRALLNTAERLKDKKVSQQELNNFMYFIFPLGARRALDFAKFFDFKDKDLADLKRQQAQILGKAQAQTVAKDWEGLATSLINLADLEEKFKSALLQK